MGLRSDMRTAVQGFAPDEIDTTTAATDYPVSDILAIRVSVDSEYYINADSSNKATMLAGSVTVIANSVTTIQFTNATVIEIMHEK